MKRAMTCLLFLLALGACGGGDAANSGTNSGGAGQPNNNPVSANTDDGNSADDGKVDPPKKDPNWYKMLYWTVPAGWDSLTSKSPVRTELERHIKPVPASWKPANGIVNSEAPGSTEPPEKWSEWEKQAAGAMLYFVGDKEMTPKAAVEAHAKDLAAGVPDIKEAGGIAWTEMQGGEVLVIGISNRFGTYIAVGVVLTTEPEPAREAIRTWAQSIKPE